MAKDAALLSKPKLGKKISSFTFYQNLYAFITTSKHFCTTQIPSSCLILSHINSWRNYNFKNIGNSFDFFASYAAFTLNGFDDQERNLTFVKTVFQVLKFKFFMLVILSKLSILFISYISRDLGNINRLIQDFRSVRGCQTCMCKRGISDPKLRDLSSLWSCKLIMM